jgi:sugar diacid utilization regulator/putative methionine-R-sulfoxide reductase with GAF domain
MTDSLTQPLGAPRLDDAEGLVALLASAPSNVREAAVLASRFLGDIGVTIRAIDERGTVCVLVGEGAGVGQIDELRGPVRVDVRVAPEHPVGGSVAALREWLRLIAERDRYRHELVAMSAESDSQSHVADEILSIRDLDQVLLSIVNRTLVLLDSDICGVLLRDGDVIEMKACVGHRVVETANLRMQRGQGLAGLVFASGRHGRVDSYVDDRTISPDFIPLAEQEETRSALAVPLLAHGEIIGVLEVWRRRASTFSEPDVRRMLALGSLASIAIENARLYDLQALTLARLTAAHEAMEHQVALLDRSARVQSALLHVVLDQTGAYERIVRTIADEYGCRAVYARENGVVEACYPPLGDPAQLPALSGVLRTHRKPATRILPGGQRMWSQAVVVGDHEVGSVNLIGGDDTDEVMRVAVSQAAMACALARLEQRAASQARNAAFDQIIWDLLDGPPDHRSAALSRAGELGLILHGPHRIVRGVLGNIDDVARAEGWDTAAADHARRAVLTAVKRASVAPRLRLVSVRGDWLVGILACEGAAETRSAVTALAEAARSAVPGLVFTAGVSSAYTDALRFHDAHREAIAALTGAQRLRAGDCSLYDELGIVRILLGGAAGDADLQRFVDDVAGPLREYDRKHDGSLVKTLRAYFDNDCSQRRAAEALYIHPKTLSYRLGQISELSGLDLQLHSDRVRADLALRMLQLTESTDDAAS